MIVPEFTERRAEWGFRLVFVFLAAGIIAVGYVYYRNYERNFRLAAEYQLSSIGELKVGGLVQYRQERLADANRFAQNPVFSTLVRRFFEQPADTDVHRQLQAWIGASRYQYGEVRLLDNLGATRMSSPAGLPAVSSPVARNIPEVLQSGEVSIQDFFRNDYDRRIQLAVLVPIRDEANGTRPLGMLVLGIEPESFLYPFIKRWPTPSPTAETLLLRQDGDGVLYLNDLRHESNAAFGLRLPLERAEVPAVRAALGQTGITMGVDYRGVPVVAALQAVPDSPWFLVTKIDVAEVYAPARERLWQVVLTTGALLLGAGASVRLVWRKQRIRYYRERAESSEAVRGSELRYRRLFESAKNGILILDAATGIAMDVNPCLVEMLGLPHDVVLGQKVWELGFFRSIVTSHAHFVELRRKDYIRYEDVPLEDGDGRWIEVEFISNVYGVSHQRVFQCNVRDITERKAAEALLQHTLADLERSNKELEQFAYVASHDLQEPLRMVASYTQLLAQRYEGQLDDKARKYIGYAVDGAIRMQSLINDLLAYSRIGTRGHPLESTDSHSALGEAIRNLAATIEEKRAIITNDDLPTVRADPSQLVLVFQNLISNAIKFRGTDLPRVHVSAQQHLGEWVFAVKDNGIGIDPQHAERVFVIFQRLHTREEYPGTGIGLAVCHRIVQRHGGKIWYESKPGHGATFFFTVLR